MTSTPFILVIGDSFIATSLNQLLEQHAYRSVIVPDLQAADRAVRAVIPDLIMVEYTYTVQHLVDSLHSHLELPFIPIIVVYDDEKQLVVPEITNIDGFLRCRATTVEQLAQIQLGIQLSRTRREMLQQRQHLQLLYDISRSLHRSLDIDLVLKRILELLAQTFRSARGSILLLDEYGNIWRRILFRDHLSIEEQNEALDQVMKSGLAAYAMRDGTVQIVSDTRTDPRWLRLEENEDVGSALALPLRDHGTNAMLGVLIMVHHSPHYFTNDILALAKALIEQLELALTNATVHTRLREAEESRQAFIHMLTHDLRTPLSGMISCFDALQTLELNDTAGLFVELGLQAGEEQQRLIDDLLDVYKAETGAIAIRRTRTSLATLGQIVQRQLGARILDAGLYLTMDIPGEPAIFVDEQKMARVLMNLISNSIKWTERGGRIELSGTISDSTITLIICDTGVGIPEAELPYIFNRFYQGSIRGSSRGTGLGLTFAKLTIEGHEGMIHVQSSVGEGTTITIELPRLQELVPG